MNYNVIFLELLTVLLGMILLIITLIIPRRFKKTAGYISVLGLVAILAVSVVNSAGKPAFFSGSFYILDSLSLYFKQAFLTAAILVTLMSLGYLDKIQSNQGEFFAFLVFSLTGMMIMTSANDFLTLYIGLELMTIAFVVLTAFKRDSGKSSEAGMKYVFLSAMSSAALLYGISLIYGCSGSFVFPDIIKFLESASMSPALILAVVMVIAGFAFKISAVPFHMWSPDIYEGAPAPVTAFLAIGSKAAGFSVMIRVLFQVLPSASGTFITLIIVLAALSIIVGNLIAIPQSNFKRLLAYSSIAHAGYILLGIVAYTKLGIGAMLYYIFIYIFANAGAFASLIAFSSQTGSSEINGLSGMWKRSPLISGVLLISLLSLAGIPPAAGFTGKFLLFSEAIRQGYIWIAFLAIGMSVVSVYYYIIVVRVMLMGDAVDVTPVKVPLSLRFVMIVSMAATLFMGIYPGPVIEWTGSIASLFLNR